jgi:hypothetical protein
VVNERRKKKPFERPKERISDILSIWKEIRSYLGDESKAEI